MLCLTITSKHMNIHCILSCSQEYIQSRIYSVKNTFSQEYIQPRIHSTWSTFKCKHWRYYLVVINWKKGILLSKAKNLQLLANFIIFFYLYSFQMSDYLFCLFILCVRNNSVLVHFCHLRQRGKLASSPLMRNICCCCILMSDTYRNRHNNVTINEKNKQNRI